MKKRRAGLRMMLPCSGPVRCMHNCDILKK
jgi:hypothetical protein